MSDDDKVGYKNPPKATQWKKGQSGNPSGRAKGQRNLKTELLEELAETILVRERGTPQTVSKLRAILKAQTAKAIQGDIKATAFLLSTYLRLYDDGPGDDSANASFSDCDREIIEDFLKRHSGSGGKT